MSVLAPTLVHKNTIASMQWAIKYIECNKNICQHAKYKRECHKNGTLKMYLNKIDDYDH